MGMSVGNKSDVNSEPNVIPMIDIMLVLLIIFMIVTPVIAGGFTATMPQGKNVESRPDVDDDIILGIDEDGQYYLDPGTGEIGPLVRRDDFGCGSSLNESACQREAFDQAQSSRLTEVLGQIYQARTRDAILYFRADANLTYAVVEDAMDLARKAGVRVLSTVTDLRRDNGVGGD